MKTFPLLGLVALGALTSCDALNNMNPMAGGGGGGQAMVDSMKDQPAMNVMALPPGASVGTWWEMDMGGMKQKNCIVAEKDGQFIVEQTMANMPIQAFQVDPSVNLMRQVKPGDMSTTNVTAAWVGVEGEAPVERKVMAAVKIPEVTGDAPAVEVEEGTATVSLGGKDWDTKWMKASGSTTWMADGFTLKSEMNGKTMMALSGMGNDAKPMLDWEKK